MDKSKPFNIPLPEDDRIFKKVTGRRAKYLKFFRSEKKRSSEGLAPLNAISSHIDGSAIYGSTRRYASKLRTFEDGLMITENKRWMPFNDEGLFMGGDHRASENPVLAAIHTIFLREHNSIAKLLKRKFPEWNDEKIYQEARKINIAQVQSITYREFLPAMLGDGVNSMDSYKYDEKINPTISALFSTAAFRVGHSLLKGRVQLVSYPGLKLKTMKLTDIFFKPEVLLRVTALRFLLGAIRFNTQDVDLKIHSALRNFLFTNVKDQVGFDLAASNIQRGRDHRLPTYNEARAIYNLPRRQKFEQICSDRKVTAALKEAYDGDIDSVDVWIGGLAEDHVRGSSLGELFYRSWIEEFKKLRNGDRFFFTKKDLFSPEVRSKIARVRKLTTSDSVLKDILVRNTPVTRDALKGSLFIRNPKLERQEAKRKNPGVSLEDPEIVEDSLSPSPATSPSPSPSKAPRSQEPKKSSSGGRNTKVWPKSGAWRRFKPRPWSRWRRLMEKLRRKRARKRNWTPNRKRRILSKKA